MHHLHSVLLRQRLEPPPVAEFTAGSAFGESFSEGACANAQADQKTIKILSRAMWVGPFGVLIYR